MNLHPPEVTGVTETPTQGATPVNFYSVGGISGVNQTPWTINITFNGPISPSTLNASTVQLVDLGSNPSQPLDQDINLSGKISYISSTDTLVINLAAAGLTLGNRRLPDHPVRQRIAGDHQPQGVALDGENTQGGLSTGANWPSLGQRLPRRQLLRLVHHQHDAAVGRGRHADDAPASDTNIVGDNITDVDAPHLRRHDQRAQPATWCPSSARRSILDIGI